MFDIFGPKDPQAALQKASEYLNEGRTDAAIKVLESNLTDSEDSFDIFLLLSRLYFENDQRPRAVEMLRHIHSIVPSRTDEIIAILSDLYFRHASMDAADFLIQLNVEHQKYEEINKILRALSEREIKLLLTRYDKLRQGMVKKKALTKRDVDVLFIFASIEFFIDESVIAMDSVEPVMDIKSQIPHLLRWARTIARERHNDPYAALLLLRSGLAHKEFDSALAQAQRIFGKFPDFIDPLIEVITSKKVPQEVEATFSHLLADLYVKKGDFDASIDRLRRLLKEDRRKIDEIIKSLRDLERTNPKNLKILYALSDTYLDAHRTSLAINELDKILEIEPKQYDQVIEKYRAIFDEEPNEPLVIQGLVSAYLKRDDVDRAVEIIQTAYESDPGLLDEYVANLNLILEKKLDNPKALCLLGICYAHKGDQENSLVIFENLMAKGRFNDVFTAMSEICEQYPENVHYLSFKTKSLAMLGKEEEALSILTPYVAEKPAEMAVFVPTLDAIMSRRADLFEKILPLYEQYKKEEPFIGELALARAYAFAGDYQKSVSSFEQCFTNEEYKDATKRALVEVIKEKQDAVPLLLAAARIYMLDGEVKIAIKFFKTAQKIDPEAFFEIIDEFYDVLKVFPNDREVWISLIEMFANRKVWDRVIEEAKKAIEIFGEDAQYFNMKLGEALIESGNLSGSVRPLMLSLEGAEDYSEAVIEYLDKILEIDKSNLPAHFARARALSKARRINEAVEEYLLTVRVLPARTEYVYNELKTLSSIALANPRVVFALGNLEISLGKYGDASKHLLQACELDATMAKQVIPLFEKLSKETPSALLDFSLARVYHLANLRSSATKLYVKAQEQDKSFREPAISELKKICSENPHDIESRKGLAEVYYNYSSFDDVVELVNEIYRSNTKECAWAKNLIGSILQKNASHIPSYFLLAFISLNEEDHRTAIELYTKLIELSPTEVMKVAHTLEEHKEKSSELLLYLGTLYKDTGEIKKAVDIFDKLFSTDPSCGDTVLQYVKEILMKNADLGDAYLLASKIFVLQKEYDKSIEVLQRAKELIPENEEIILKEGQLYYEKGEAEKAIRVYTELLDKSKNRTLIYRLIKKMRDKYFKERINAIKGNGDEDRLKRADIYLLINKIRESEKELDFTPQSDTLLKQQALMKAKVYLKKSLPVDALEMMRNLPVDKETAPIYADIYDSLGSYEAAAIVLRQAGIEGMEQRIASYEKLAQDRRLAKGRYFVEGRSR
ncbi:MAG: tetratricopeptide repeat protein [candidate division WOR-3 bacterium]|nr:MAG: tetratricopeptide repeat protein [candidate division WOR-3 bacterium]